MEEKYEIRWPEPDSVKMQEVHGGHAPSFLFFAKLDIKSPNLQPVVFLAKIKDQQCVYYFLSIYELLSYFPSFVVSKSQRIEIFDSIFSVMFSHAQLL